MRDSFSFTDYGRQVGMVARSLMFSMRGAAEISGRMHLLLLAMERDLARFNDPREACQIACGPGCGACCVVNVNVLFPEAVSIAWFLRRRFPQAELDALKERLKTLLMRTRWLDDEERLFLRASCAFLDQQGRCMIHAVRPLLCRAITSTSAEACQEAINMVALHGAPTVEMNLFQKNLVETVYYELAGALEELGYDHRPRGLSSAVLARLAEPGIVDQYSSGKVLPVH